MASSSSLSGLYGASDAGQPGAPPNNDQASLSQARRSSPSAYRPPHGERRRPSASVICRPGGGAAPASGGSDYPSPVRQGWLNVGGSHGLQQFMTAVASEAMDPRTGRPVAEESRRRQLMNTSEAARLEREKNAGMWLAARGSGLGCHAVPAAPDAFVAQRRFRRREPGRHLPLGLRHGHLVLEVLGRRLRLRPHPLAAHRRAARAGPMSLSSRSSAPRRPWNRPMLEWIGPTRPRSSGAPSRNPSVRCCCSPNNGSATAMAPATRLVQVLDLRPASIPAAA